MDQQLRLGDLYLTKGRDNDTSTENHLTQHGEEGAVYDYEIHPEEKSEFSDAATLEQRRAYKIEIQVGHPFLNEDYIKLFSYTCPARMIIHGALKH